jgi:hypothetical protein
MQDNALFSKGWRIVVPVAMLWACPVLSQEWVVLAQACDAAKPATTPLTRFKLNQDGTATDQKTGLMWIRCAMGQTWTGESCSVHFVKYTWEYAFDAIARFNGDGFAGYKDWRLPTVDELASIVEHQCYDPAINLQLFPTAPITGYWSSAPDPAYSRGAMLVHFKYGGQYMGNKSQDWAVRLVRGGPQR